MIKNKIFKCLAPFALLYMLTFTSEAADFHISPGEKIHDHPVAAHSVADAMKSVKFYRKQHPGESIKLIFHEGTYRLKETIYLSPELNGLSLASAPGEKVVFDGGAELKFKGHAQINDRDVLVFGVPEQAVVNGFLDQLYVNDRRAQVAQTPKSYFTPRHPEKFLPEATVAYFKTDFFYNEGDFDPDWYNMPGIDMHILSSWYDIHTPVGEINAAERKIHFTDKKCIWSKPKETCVIWRNVREALSEKGEYYFDNRKMELYYIPRDGENEKNIEAVVPVNSLLFLAAGDEKNDRKISNITIDGIIFRHGGAGRLNYTPTYEIPGAEKLPVLHDEFNRFQPLRQAACFNPAIVSFQYADHCRVVNCHIEHGNFYAIGALSGVTDFEVSSNTITDMGAGGILVNGVDAERCPESAKLVTERITICNNHIYECGKFDFAGLGILIGFARGTLVEHNLIHDLYYTGISAGWSWGYAPATGGENRIGFNHIYNIGKKMLSDMGGIYLLGIQPGTRVYNNLVHDISCRHYGGWALYADEGSSHQVWERNVCYNCTRNAFHQHYGRENIIRDNVFAFCEEELIRTSMCEAAQRRNYRFPGLNYRHDFNIYGNILVSDGQPFLRATHTQIFSPEELYCDNNLFFDIKLPVDKSVIAIKKEIYDADWPGGDIAVNDTLSAWQKRGLDRHSIWGDPGFVDAAKRDFHLKPDSLALRSGFRDPAPTLDFAGLLPESCTPAPKIENDCYDWYLRHEQKCKEVEARQFEILFIGDSITHFWDRGSWEKHFGERALNLGFGSDRTQNVLWRIGHGEVENQKPRTIILEIGTNQFSGTANYQPDTPLDASRGICAVINALRQKFPQPIPIYVMAIFPRRGLQSQIDAANALTKEFCATLPHVKFIDLKAAFTQADGTLKTELYRQDGTHLAPAGYEIWAQAIQKELDKK